MKNPRMQNFLLLIRSYFVYINLANTCTKALAVTSSHIFTLFSLLKLSVDHVEVKMSGLKALCSLVRMSGPILPHSVAKIISRFPLDSLTPSLPSEETLQLLELLLACVTSGNRSLALPLTTAVHLFTEYCTPTNDQQVCI